MLFRSVGATPSNVIYSNGDVAAANLVVNGNITALDHTNLGPIENITIDGGNPAYVLATDGAGNLTWVAQTEGGTAGGANTYIQFNDAGYLNGISTFTFNKSTNTANVPNLIVGTAINAGNIINGNSNIIMTANGNINMSVRGINNMLRLSNTGFYSNSEIFNIAARIEQMGGNPNGAQIGRAHV